MPMTEIALAGARSPSRRDKPFTFMSVSPRLRSVNRRFISLRQHDDVSFLPPLALRCVASVGGWTDRSEDFVFLDDGRRLV